MNIACPTCACQKCKGCGYDWDTGIRLTTDQEKGYLDVKSRLEIKTTSHTVYNHRGQSLVVPRTTYTNKSTSTWVPERDVPRIHLPECGACHGSGRQESKRRENLWCQNCWLLSCGAHTVYSGLLGTVGGLFAFVSEGCGVRRSITIGACVGTTCFGLLQLKRFYTERRRLHAT